MSPTVGCVAADTILHNTWDIHNLIYVLPMSLPEAHVACTYLLYVIFHLVNFGLHVLFFSWDFKICHSAVPARNGINGQLHANCHTGYILFFRQSVTPEFEKNQILLRPHFFSHFSGTCSLHSLIHQNRGVEPVFHYFFQFFRFYHRSLAFLFRFLGKGGGTPRHFGGFFRIRSSLHVGYICTQNGSVTLFL